MSVQIVYEKIRPKEKSLTTVKYWQNYVMGDLAQYSSVSLSHRHEHFAILIRSEIP